MKKTYLAFIPKSIAFVAFTVFFSAACNNQKSTESGDATISGDELTTSLTSVADGSIVYVNVDSLMQNYLMAEDLSNELAEKAKKLDAELTNKQKKHQANINDFRNKAEKGLETRNKLAEMEQQLMGDEQNLMQLSETYRMQMAEEQGVMQRKILQAIMDYLKEYNKEKGYQYILANSFGGQLLYANPKLDITASVLDGINAKYKAEHPAPAKK